jgi:hypothetical protein
MQSMYKWLVLYRATVLTKFVKFISSMNKSYWNSIFSIRLCHHIHNHISCQATCHLNGRELALERSRRRIRDPRRPKSCRRPGARTSTHLPYSLSLALIAPPSLLSTPRRAQVRRPTRHWRRGEFLPSQTPPYSMYSSLLAVESSNR